MSSNSSSIFAEGAARGEAFIGVWAELGCPEGPKQYRRRGHDGNAQNYHRTVLDPHLARLGGGLDPHMDQEERWMWAHKNLRTARQSVANKLAHEERMMEEARLAYTTRVPVGGLRQSFAPPVDRFSLCMGYGTAASPGAATSFVPGASSAATGSSTAPRSSAARPSSTASAFSAASPPLAMTPSFTPRPSLTSAPMARIKPTSNRQPKLPGVADPLQLHSFRFAPVYLKREHKGNGGDQDPGSTGRELRPMIKRESASSLGSNVSPFIKQEPGFDNDCTRIKDERD